MTTSDDAVHPDAVDNPEDGSTVQDRLYATTDAMVWAEEFCKLFAGYWINHNGTDGHPGQPSIDPGTMVGWFANYWGVITQKFANQPLHEGTWYAFLYFYHLDCSNAAFHTNSPRFSPITFRLAEFIKSCTNPVTPCPSNGDGISPPHVWDDPRLQHVLLDLGRYEEDRGR